MSFILDALKKSENRRRKKSAQLPRSIHEPVAYKIARPRQWTLWVLLFLVINAALLVWLVSSWMMTTDSESISTHEPAQLTERNIIPVRESEATELVAIDVSSSPDQTSGIVDTTQPTIEVISIPANLPIPRTEKKVYAFQQLPASIQQQIPELQMALHAYNREDSGTSMIQLNNRIYREGDKISTTLTLESITAEGAVVRYDGYRFLLPRRRS
jgi:Type II secretion system protein B